MALRFKLDENIPARAIAALSIAGHDVHTARQTASAILALLEAGVRLSAAERTAGQLWVLDEQRVRIRD